MVAGRDAAILAGNNLDKTRRIFERCFCSSFQPKERIVETRHRARFGLRQR